MNRSDIAVFVTVDAVFPGVVADEVTMLSTLSSLSRDDALFTCARLNAVVSGFGQDRSLHQRQTQAMGLLCSAEQLQAFSRFAAKQGGPERVVAFFRGQLLELAYWIATHCENKPGDGETFREESARSAFVKAALIASDLWRLRLFGAENIQPKLDSDAQLRELLGAFRKSVEEGNQTAHPGFVVSRGWMLFSRYVPEKLGNFPQLFERATGLTLRQYFICAFAILDRSFSYKPEEERIFVTDYMGGESTFRETFAKFLQVQSQTPEEWAQSLKTAPGDSSYRSLRDRPIFRFERDRSIIFDPTFYLDNLTAAPLFKVLSTKSVSENELFGAFGTAFERYAVSLLRRRFPDGNGLLYQPLRCSVAGKNARGKEFEIDALLNDYKGLVVFEMKAAWIREDAILSASSNVFLNEIRKKYGYLESSDERPKGVAQLARSIGAIMNREWTGPAQEYGQVSAIYPVLTVFDTRMAAPGLGDFLDDEFQALLGPVPTGVFVHRLIIMTAEDLEHLASGVETLSLEGFLRAYSSADPDRTSSVHNFIANSPFLNEVRPSPILEEQTEIFMAEVRAELGTYPTSGS